MLERSGLTANDKKLVMTGVNLDNVGNVVDDMVNSMKKYFGEGIRDDREKRSNNVDKPLDRATIKEEPVYNGERIYSESSKSMHSSSDTCIHLKKRKPSTQTGGIEENLTRHGEDKIAVDTTTPQDIMIMTEIVMIKENITPRDTVNKEEATTDLLEKNILNQLKNPRRSINHGLDAIDVSRSCI